MKINRVSEHMKLFALKAYIAKYKNQAGNGIRKQNQVAVLLNYILLLFQLGETTVMAEGTGRTRLLRHHQKRLEVDQAGPKTDKSIKKAHSITSELKKSH